MIWQIEQVHVDATKFDRQIHFDSDVFSAVFVVIAEAPYVALKVAKKWFEIFIPKQSHGAIQDNTGSSQSLTRKTLDNNDLNQVGRPAVLVKTRVWVGCSVSLAHKTWSRSFLSKDVLLTQPQSDQQAIFELPQASVSNRG